MTTRIISCCVSIRGREWLYSLFSPIIREMSGSYEVRFLIFFLMTKGKSRPTGKSEDEERQREAVEENMQFLP